MKENKNIPEWNESNASGGFASKYSNGTVEKHVINPQKVTAPRLKQMSPEEYCSGILNGNRTALARAITLIESSSPKHVDIARRLLNLLLPHSGKSIRIGITGAPGAGKSTFIDSFGNYLANLNHNVAILAIDPSSARSRGSIMGDKTRMERLSQLKNVFVRPSPSGGNLGGVARKTRESIIACEAAGFDVIIIETIGAGQSEVAARSMVDFFMLLLLPGEGDELQGLKKGTVELSDAIIINKADGDNVFKAQSTLVSYKTAVHYLLPATEGWETCVLTASALNDNGIDDIWQKILEFEEITKQSGVFQERRRSQAIEWVHAIINDSLKTQFYSNAKVKNIIPSIEEKVSNGTMNSAEAAQILLQAYEGKILPD